MSASILDSSAKRVPSALVVKAIVLKGLSPTWPSSRAGAMHMLPGTIHLLLWLLCPPSHGTKRACRLQAGGRCRLGAGRTGAGPAARGRAGWPRGAAAAPFCAMGCGPWALLVLLCGAAGAAAPLRCNVSLESPAEQRWLPVLRHFEPAFLRAAVRRIIECVRPGRGRRGGRGERGQAGPCRAG